MMRYLGYFFTFQTVIFFVTLSVLLTMYLFAKVRRHTRTIRTTLREMWAMLFP